MSKDTTNSHVKDVKVCLRRVKSLASALTETFGARFWFSYSILCAQRMRTADYLNIVNEPVIPETFYLKSNLLVIPSTYSTHCTDGQPENGIRIIKVHLEAIYTQNKLITLPPPSVNCLQVYTDDKY